MKEKAENWEKSFTHIQHHTNAVGHKSGFCALIFPILTFEYHFTAVLIPTHFPLIVQIPVYTQW